MRLLDNLLDHLLQISWNLELGFYCQVCRHNLIKSFGKERAVEADILELREEQNENLNNALRVVVGNRNMTLPVETP